MSAAPIAPRRSPAPVESHDEWARRVLEEHGPPPQQLRDHVASLMKRPQRRT